MSISVVLSAYNGSKYIEEQLNSLLTQTLAPDEIIIADDCSTDNTFDIIKKFISDNALDTWRVERHPENLGWRKSFYNLILSAKGDYVFLCDQDDIWDSRKIEIMYDSMELHLEISVLACSVRPIYEKGAQKTWASQKKVSKNSSSKLRIQPIDKDFAYVKRPGCCYCARKDFINIIMPYWNTDWAHDEVLWNFAAISGTLGLFDQQFVRFRRHEGNASRRTVITKQLRIKEVEFYLKKMLVTRQFVLESKFTAGDSLQLIDEMEKWLRARLGFLLGNKSLSNFRMMVAGRSYYASSLSLLVDVLARIGVSI